MSRVEIKRRKTFFSVFIQVELQAQQHQLLALHPPQQLPQLVPQPPQVKCQSYISYENSQQEGLECSQRSDPPEPKSGLDSAPD